ncbi:tryptophan synthase beta subunit-like PLP-dependent enzyme [Dactylonectria macrodidyma]|uniref:Probable succinyl-diaminopimelate desuccinylase n=1 Tax=Dactylonectria macrodidyma TaxID=307937 RepID=A0A9P9IJL3_9HYPO|nr:tryptophan synthase beta subunit-like PLP-dependent enzyme [Dactylonectria macrodidyma]
MATAARRPVFFNPGARSWTAPPASDEDPVDKFHRRMPEYRPTSLSNLDAVAKEIGVGAVHLKNEGDRFGMPSFKILGASWGTFRAIVQLLGLPVGSDIETVRANLSGKSVSLYAATDGNHGRAVARMGVIFGIPAEIHVPATMQEATVELIRSEGASIVVSSGTYDEAVDEAYAASKKHEGGILIQDFAFDDYQDFPQWIVDGYLTMLREVDEQLSNTAIDLVVAPVGVGSFAQAVVTHAKRAGSGTAVMVVEPDTAACLWKNLQRGELTTEKTSPTIMAGLDCGTPSTIAWPLLRDGVEASVTVSDYEAHEAAVYLKSLGISAGPCGAAPLAALRRLTAEDKSTLGLNEKSVVVLLCTEAGREYPTPLSVSSDDPIILTQTLVQINSANPSLGAIPGPGETAVARYITSWLEHRDIESHWIEPTKGRPSVVGVARGSGGGKSILFNGHIDTVTLGGYDGDPLSGHIIDGKLHGRGAADMKAGVAAAMVALARAKKLGLAGDVIFAGVADEEALSTGTQDVLAAGWRANGAVVSEPTDMAMIHAHKGFVWLDVRVHGVAGHGSLPDLSVDAIAKAGHFLAEIDRLSARLREGSGDPTVGTPTVHASLVKGGEEISSYPALCTVSLERRTIPGETPESVQQEIQDILDNLTKQVPDFKADVTTTFHRSPFHLPLNDPFTKLVKDCVGKALGEAPTIKGEGYWTDCALLADAGIPSLLWGPRGEGLHAKEEWVDVESVKQVADALTDIATRFCK